jgi:hypothetical protein
VEVFCAVNVPRSDTRFLFLSLTSFSGLPQRELALAAGLALRGYEVDYVEGMPSLAACVRDFLNGRMTPMLNERIHGVVEPERLTVHRPPMVPTFFRSSWTPAIDRTIFLRWYEREFRDQPWDRTVAFITLPYWWKWFLDAKRCPAHLLISDHYDALEVFARNEVARRRMEESVRKLAEDVDGVTSSSHVLLKDLEPLYGRRPMMHLPNAVDLDLAEKGCSKRSVNAPNVLYVGATYDARMNWEWLYLAACKLPGREFHIVGPVDSRHIEESKRYPNIRFHGPVQHDEFLALAGQCSVGIIPYNDNAIARVTNPLKLYEYSAWGLKIVASRSEELEKYSDNVLLASTGKQFVDLIYDALQHQDENAIERAVNFARSNTWDHRVSSLLSFTKSLYHDAEAG